MDHGHLALTSSPPSHRNGWVLTPKELDLAVALRPTIERVKNIFVPLVLTQKPHNAPSALLVEMSITLIFPVLLRNLSDRALGLDISCEPYRPNLIARMAAGDIYFAFAARFADQFDLILHTPPI